MNPFDVSPSWLYHGIGIQAQGLPHRDGDLPTIDDHLRVGKDRRRLLADRERLARAVEDRAASGRQLDRLPLLLQREGFVRRAAHALQPGRAPQRHREGEDEDEEKETDPAVERATAHFGGSST